MNNDKIAANYLREVAATAETLAYELENNKLWPGQFSNKIAAIRAALENAQRNKQDARV